MWRCLSAHITTEPAVGHFPMLQGHLVLGEGHKERPLNLMGTGLLVYAFGLHRNMSFFVVGHAVLDKAQRCHSVSLRMAVQKEDGEAHPTLQ